MASYKPIFTILGILALATVILSFILWAQSPSEIFFDPRGDPLCEGNPGLIGMGVEGLIVAGVLLSLFGLIYTKKEKYRPLGHFIVFAVEFLIVLLVFKFQTARYVASCNVATSQGIYFILLLLPFIAYAIMYAIQAKKVFKK